MAFGKKTDMNDVRTRNNAAVGLCLVALIALVVTLSLVKLVQSGAQEGFDHVRRPALEETAQ